MCIRDRLLRNERSVPYFQDWRWRGPGIEHVGELKMASCLLGSGIESLGYGIGTLEQGIFVPRGWVFMPVVGGTILTHACGLRMMAASCLTAMSMVWALWIRVYLAPAVGFSCQWWGGAMLTHVCGLKMMAASCLAGSARASQKYGLGTLCQSEFGPSSWVLMAVTRRCSVDHVWA